MERRGEAGGGDIAEGETAGCCAGDAPDADSEAISEPGGFLESAPFSKSSNSRRRLTSSRGMIRIWKKNNA